MANGDYEKDILTKKSIEQRGKILNAMANFEVLFNVYLAHYFCGSNTKKIEEMILIIFGDDRTTLSAKAQMFSHIATNHDKKWYDSYVSLRKPQHKKKPYSLNSDIVFIIQERNVFAHRYLTTDDDLNGNPTPKNVLRFVKFKNDLEPLDYTDEMLNDIYKTIIYIMKHFIENKEFMKDARGTFETH